jgi:methionyl-tRNA formyltransferase
MKFVYFGYDFMLPAIKRLMDEGHELIGIFSFDCDNIFNFNTECQALAQEKGLPFILSPVEDFHITSFLGQGAQLFLAAGYPHKLPPVDEKQAYAVNVHPTYLPKARGLMPIPRIIMEHMEDAAGFTAHKMTQKFDEGDILLQVKFDLSPGETVETYCAKIAMRAPDMFTKLVGTLPALWKKSKPQNKKETTYLTPPTDEQRVFDWNKTVQEIDAVGRAFGRFGSLARFNNQLWVVYSYTIWEETHDFTPGIITASLSRETILAAKNGFVCLKEFQPVNAQ